MENSPKNHSQRLPWWVYVTIAAILYIGLSYFAPTLHTKTPWVGALLYAAPKMAPIVTIVFLLLGANALYNSPERNNHPMGKKEGSDWRD